LEHSSEPDAKREITKYCRNGWLAIRCEERDPKGSHIMLRYDKLRRSLKIGSEGISRGSLRIMRG